MADKGSNNWLWWSIGGVATLGLGLGIYYYLQTKKEEERKKQEELNKQNDKPNPTPTPAPTPAPTPTPTTEVDLPKSTPFTSVEQSNAFRAWVNSKYPDYAKDKKLEMNLSNPNTMNNSTIQLAWGKFSDAYYTDNAGSLNLLTLPLVTGANKISGGLQWKSTDDTPRGEVTMYTDGKITANAVNSQLAQTKFVQGGWYKIGSTYHFMIGGKNYDVGILGVRDTFWNIIKQAGIYNDATNSYSAFNGRSGNLGKTKFGLVTDGTEIQDEIL